MIGYGIVTNSMRHAAESLSAGIHARSSSELEPRSFFLLFFYFFYDKVIETNMASYVEFKKILQDLTDRVQKTQDRL